LAVEAVVITAQVVDLEVLVAVVGVTMEGAQQLKEVQLT
jgi:hypothetical protein